MKKFNNVLWGIALVAVGVLLAMKVLGVLPFDIFFDGWWTLFLIVPFGIDLISGKDKTVSAIGFGIGVLLLLACQDILSFKLIWKLILPFVIVVVGIRLIFKDFFDKKTTSAIAKINAQRKAENKEYTALFSGQNLRFDGEVFTGVKFTSIFGGIKCDLRNAIINEDAVIEATCVFGGADILLPMDVNVKIVSDCVFGGITNKKPESSVTNAATVFVKASCIFGGIDIK